MKRVGKIVLTFLVDSVLVLVFLCVFALFHHVIPREIESENVVIESNDNICSCEQENVYSCKTEVNDNSYVSENISIKIEKFTENIGGRQVIYHVADIHVKDIKSIQSVFADDTYGRGYNEWLKSMTKRTDSILAINGDFYGLASRSVVIRNGVLYRSSKTGADIGVLFSNGSLKTYLSSEFDADKVIEEGAYQAWSFGPSLLDSNGGALTKFPTSSVWPKNPRSAIGYYSPGHYAFVVVEGRTDSSAGMTLTELSSLFNKLGCKTAYNLDGGQSSVMVFNNKTVNELCEGGRTLSDAIVIKEVSND